MNAKKSFLVSWMTSCLIAIGPAAFPVAAKYSGGTGAPNDPYQIATAADLILLGDSPGDYGRHFILTADIDLDPNLPGRKVFQGAVIAWDANHAYWDWAFDGTPFTGVFDGRGHSLVHLSLVDNTHMGWGYVGLFGKLGVGGKITNLGLEAVDVNAAEGYVGSLVAHNEGCIVLSHSEGCRVRGSGWTGGLVGVNDGSIVASYSTGWITGGLTGGLVGENSNSIIASYSTCMIVNGYYAGGLVGENHGSITTSYSTGAVRGDEYAGGLVGQTIWESSITMCYSTGRVTSRQWRGGLIGGRGEDGENRVVASFWDTATSGQANSEGGVGLETSRMQDVNTFLSAGWDFADEVGNGACDYWEMAPGEYPRLRYHTGAGPVMPEGAGTAQQPYVIGDARDLGTVWSEPLAHYCLTEHVDLEGITWPAAAVPWFSGTFDGRGFAFRHFCARGGTHLGLFGQLTSAAVLSNLGLDGARVSGTGVYIGGLVGASWGTIRNCYSVGGVINGLGGALRNDDDRVGGLVGLNHGRIAGSRSSGVVTGNGAGGLAGFNDGWISTSYSAGTVEGGNHVGGLVGSHQGRITVSHSACTVRGGTGAGGLVGGFAEAGEMSECFSTGAVYGISHLGGLVGRIDSGRVSQCYSTAAVYGSDYVGGLVGWNAYTPLWRCYSAGAVRGGSHTGGLVGARVQAETNASIDCLWDVETSGQATSAGGTGKTTAEMQDINTFRRAGWDFAGETADGTCDYWQMRPGEYPQFRYYAGQGPVMPEGSGTAEQPYLIRDARDLGTVWFEPTAHYRLAQSVDLAGSTWSMAVVPWFGGTFDGAGRVITNLRIRGRDYVGLFGRLVPGAKVAGLGLEGVDVRGIVSAGALAGTNHRGSISMSYSTGMVQGDSGIGGLVGHNEGSIATSHSAGWVRGDGPAGGLVGTNFDRARIVTSYSTCAVDGDYYVGGLVGYNCIAHIVMSYSTGAVMGIRSDTGLSSAGGLVGVDEQGTVTACFWDRETSRQTLSIKGTGKTTAEMQTAATFLTLGWDFVGETANGTDDIWWINEGKDYPHLSWELTED